MGEALAFLHAVGQAGLMEGVVVVLVRRVPEALVHDGVIDGVAIALDRRHGAFVRAKERDAVHGEAGLAEERNGRGLVGQLGVARDAKFVVLRGERARRDLHELVVRQAIAADDDFVALALGRDAGRAVVAAWDRRTW